MPCTGLALCRPMLLGVFDIGSNSVRLVGYSGSARTLADLQ